MKDALRTAFVTSLIDDLSKVDDDESRSTVEYAREMVHRCHLSR